MQGCKPFSDNEIKRISEILALSRHGKRNVALFTLGIQTGFRISELLSLKIKDILQNEIYVKELRIQRRHMKKQTAGRSVPLTSSTYKKLAPWVSELREMGYLSENDYLFQSMTAANRPISRSTAWKLIHDAARTAGVTGTIGTHSMRKTFADRLYDHFRERRGRDGKPMDAMRMLAKALGHKNLDSTDKYLSFREEEIHEAIEDIFGEKGHEQLSLSTQKG